MKFILLVLAIFGLGVAFGSYFPPKSLEKAKDLITFTPEPFPVINSTFSGYRNVKKYCFETFIWVRYETDNRQWGGQQLDKDGKPISC